MSLIMMSRITNKLRFCFAINQSWLFHLSDMTQDEAYELFQDCVKEVQKRLILNLPNFAVQVIDKDGIRKMKDITVKNLPA